MLKLVIIDDESYILNQLVSLLDWNELGFEITKTFDISEDVFNFLQNNKVDAILSDISMPYPNGLDIAKYCCENLPDIPVVLISGYRDFEYAKQAIKYNVFEYITKPISYDNFYNCMKSLSEKLNSQKSITTNTSTDSPTDDIVNKVMEYIKNNYKTNITLDDIARHTSMSKGYFCSHYKYLANESFITTLNKYRIECAKELLKNPNAKASSIGFFVGFKNTQHFYRVFKSITGYTPNIYQARMNNNE